MRFGREALIPQKFGLTMFDDFRYRCFVIHLVHRRHHHHAHGASAGVFG